MMTRQEAFDKVVNHLLTQKVRSVKPGTKNDCMYRGLNGTKCAVGCLIDDEHYYEELEGGGPLAPRVATALQLSGAWEGGDDSEDREELYFYRKLQGIHDMEDPTTWYYRLEEVAHAGGLRFNPPKEATNG